jgi:ubiquinone/menaquinone biosynthesis C-methylase UbiE
MLQKQSKSWQEFWETKALSPDVLLATDFADVINGKQKYARMCRELRALLDLQSSDAFLNVGCGSGLFESSLDGDVQKIVSLDLALNMLLMARRINRSNPPLILLQGTATQLPFIGPTFDKILANSMTHYLASDHLKMALAEFKRLLKPGGRIVIGDVEEPAPPFMTRLKQVREQAGLPGVLRRILKKAFAPVWRLYRRERERYLVARRGVQPVEKPAPIARYTRDEILRLVADVGLQGYVVQQGRGALYPHRFNLVITANSSQPSAVSSQWIDYLHL